MTNEQENFDSTNEEYTEETVDETQEESEDNEDESNDESENLEALNKKIKELEAQKNHWKKKANQPKVEAKSDSNELSQKDLYALMNNKVHEDDVDEVVEYARLKNITVKDALQSSVIKAILKDNEEVRETSQVANTKTTRKNRQERTADDIVQRAIKGDMPESQEDMIKAFNKIAGLDK